MSISIDIIAVLQFVLLVLLAGQRFAVKLDAIPAVLHKAANIGVVRTLWVFQYILTVVIAKAVQRVNFAQSVQLCKSKNLAGTFVAAGSVMHVRAIIEGGRSVVVIGFDCSHGVLKADGLRIGLQLVKEVVGHVACILSVTRVGMVAEIVPGLGDVWHAFKVLFRCS